MPKEYGTNEQRNNAAMARVPISTSIHRLSFSTRNAMAEDVCSCTVKRILMCEDSCCCEGRGVRATLR